MISKLCIGSAQFGSDYGITNKNGMVKEKEVRDIFKIARKKNVELIDTAQN